MSAFTDASHRAETSPASTPLSSLRHASRVGFASLVLGLLALPLASFGAAPTSENFDGVAVSGGYSLGSVGEARAINGWTFSVLGASGTLDGNSYVDVTNRSFDTSLANDVSDKAALLQGNYSAATGTQAAAVLAASSGEEFSFQSIRVEVGPSAGSDYRLVGYLNGSAVSGATQDFTAADYGSGGTLVTVSGAVWQYVDAVRIVRQNGDVDISIYIDDVTVTTAVSPVSITSATYNANTGTLVVTGTDFSATGGAVNDIVANKFTFTGQGGSTYTLTNTANVDISSATAFTLTLSTADRAEVNVLLNKNGTSSTGATTYNLAGAAGFVAAVSGASDTTGNGITVSNSAPVVTDARISISGASGTGGACKIGDTVTATWNNTAGGDKNTNIASVTVNFSQFGGGAAVAATNSSGTWTATYTITTGAIDASNRNVSVTATDSNGQSTTTTDSTNATVDSVAPYVSNASIAISGASGTGGAYKLGDTVTASWDNSIIGDDNSDTISGVTVDFSQFGGGAAVAATNSSGTWTATHTIVSGATDTANRNVSVTASDNAGNRTTTADTTNATVDNVAPTVSNANLSISGASGTGGAFKTGDTVTATWNNTAAGDNNSDTISSVTIDFSQFGGGAAVAATNSSGTWTATYTIVSGAIDTTNRNISATARDNAGNTTTTADTTNATVDNVAPTVSDANLSISGASGTGGAFKIGDTVTATWNNTAGGDNNSDTISSVTVDFSQFGGGSAIAGTNSSGTWTATYTIVSGAISAANRNVSITASDNAGNSTATADTTNATVDSQAPTATIASAAFSADTGASSSDFITSTAAQSVSGTLSANMVSGELVEVSLDNGSTWATATTSVGANTWSLTGQTLTGSNTLRVRVADAAGNVGTTFTQAYILDTTAPAVSSVSVPASATYATGQNLDFTVNFSENVTVNTAGGTPALTLTIGASSQSAAYVSGSGTSALAFRYTVQNSDVDADGIAVGSAIVLNSGTIQDSVGNNATLTLNSVGNTTGLLVDAVAPTISSSTVSGNATYSSGQHLDFTVTYSENVTVNTGGGTPYLSVTLDTGGSVQAAYLSGSGTATLTFRYTIASGNADANGIVVASSLTLNGGTIQDSTSNNAATTGLGFGSTAGVLVDAVAPTVSSINRQTPSGATTAATSVVYRVTFSETVIGVDTSDFTVTATGAASGSVASVSAVSGAVYDVTVDTISGNGTLRLDLKNSGTGISDTPGNAIATGYTSGQTYTIDTTAPTVSAIARQSPATVNTTAGSVTWRVTFSKDVTGVDTSDFTLTVVNGTATGTLGTVTPVSGSSYDVAVTSVAGFGTLRLDLKASGTGIADLATNAIATGGFTGDVYLIGAENVFDAFSLPFAATVSTDFTSPNKPAQRFTTAASAPLALSNVTVAIGTITGTPSPVVTINADNAGAPGTVVATLTNPSSLTANALNTWTTSTLLDASTTYWVVFGVADAGGSFNVKVSTQTNGGAGNWLTAPDYFFRYGTNSGVTQTGALTLALGATNVPAITSSLTASATSGSAFTYSVTGTHSPTSFAATGLPSGLTLNTSTGVISGSPSQSGAFNVALTATNAGGTSSPATLVLTVAAPPTPPTPPSATNVTITLGATAQTYNGQPRPVTVTTAPAGIAVTVTYDGTNTAPTAPGTYTVTATVSQSGFTGTTLGTLTIAQAPQTVTFSTLSSPAVGASVSLDATASSGLPVTFSVVSGNATLTGASLKFNDGNAVTIRATQAGDTNYAAASAEQTVSATGKLAQAISFAALGEKNTNDASFTLAASASSGLPVSFSLVSGPATVSGDTVTLTGTPGTVVLTASQGGNATYLAAPAVTRTFAVVNAGPRIFIGDVVSTNATSKVGDIAVAISLNLEASVIITNHDDWKSSFKTDLALALGGTFTKRITIQTPTAGTRSVGTPPVAAAVSTVTLSGQVVNNVLSGQIEELGWSFRVLVQNPGATTSAAGFYEAPSINDASGTTSVVVGHHGEVVVLAVSGDATFGGRTTLSPNGTFTLSDTMASVAGTIDTASTTVTGTISQPGKADILFSGATVTTVRSNRLANLSSRNRVGSGARALITGFVITGAQPKRVLVRAAGPALSAFGVGSALRNPRLQLFRDGQLVQENDDWRQSANANDIAATANRIGAFPFANDSRDAAILAPLTAGAYTALVVDDSGEGVGLAEIYDASETPTTDAQRLVNISTRGESGAGENVLIGGIVVTGNTPKRLLIRGVGPALASFGVTGALTDSTLKLYDSSAKLIAQNDNWEIPQPLTNTQIAATSLDLAAAAIQAGAFELAGSGRDSALIVTLAPGNYTAHVNGNNGQTGVALIEVYELRE